MSQQPWASVGFGQIVFFKKYERKNLEFLREVEKVISVISIQVFEKLDFPFEKKRSHFRETKVNLCSVFLKLAKLFIEKK